MYLFIGPTIRFYCRQLTICLNTCRKGDFLILNCIGLFVYQEVWHFCYCNMFVLFIYLFKSWLYLTLGLLGTICYSVFMPLVTFFVICVAYSYLFNFVGYSLSWLCKINDLNWIDRCSITLLVDDNHITVVCY